MKRKLTTLISLLLSFVMLTGNLGAYAEDTKNAGTAGTKSTTGTTGTASTKSTTGTAGTTGNEKEEEMFVDNGDGTVTVNFENNETTTVLIMVENTTTKSGVTRYWYKLESGKQSVVVPMTEGYGKYKFRICKIRSDGKAVVMKSAEIELEEENETGAFDIASMIVNYQITDEAMEKAKKLTKKCKTEDEKVEKIYNYILTNFAYDYELLDEKVATKYYVSDIVSTFYRQLGICFDISCLAAGMLRTVGVEARVVTGHSKKVKEYHAWNQIYDSENEEWYTIDLTYDICKYKKGKKVSMIKDESDYSEILYKY